MKKLEEIVEIFTGDYTRDDDRLKLIDTILGLYYLVLKRAADATLSPELGEMLKAAKSHQEWIFPEVTDAHTRNR